MVGMLGIIVVALSLNLRSAKLRYSILDADEDALVPEEDYKSTPRLRNE